MIAATPISADQFARLQAHASQCSDFICLGAPGAEAGRGERFGFAALANITVTLDCSDVFADKAALARTAHFMEDQLAQMKSQPSQVDEPASQTTPWLSGGWLGFASYELGYRHLKAPTNTATAALPSADRNPLPAMQAGLYLWMASCDRQSGQYYLWIHPQCAAATQAQLAHWQREDSASPLPGHNWRMTQAFAPRQSATDFMAGVERVKEYILAGDCYQANLSQQFSGQYRGDPWRAYQALTSAHPTPYGAFLRLGDQAIVSASPERFLQISGDTVLTSPIKGTRPRGNDAEQDRALAQELMDSEKDRAENLMIVDLLRNDLGLNAATGSVRVDKLFALESYRNVHHLVSHIRATLAPDVSPLRAFFDAFPGGSITGAPKIRAMEIIQELEPHWRGPYCGSVFHRNFDGQLDSSIAIRTLVCDNTGAIHCWGGGGIVTDSEAESEYQETLTKVKPLMDCLEKEGGL
ncbi:MULTISPECIES: aminodeoxychorismate synthase component I [unclassified Marinobacter]|uniref:aminodeoxychorismate synthase component I n=1 Tax=unclassified Marinobacter TaxID=83889 RepID=UPI000BF44B98|nr:MULTISPECIES: aminodeoxychorismate synthase component I [unclassified Marinobacter]PFG08917.1 para-aminobenzoate synthetase component 1 [Marinobacter sp. LV10MA510-1]PFG54783.1 para-aminobenzoate synthetase component 1 [Marinobacter sp. LV10R520-4]